MMYLSDLKLSGIFRGTTNLSPSYNRFSNLKDPALPERHDFVDLVFASRVDMISALTLLKKESIYEEGRTPRLYYPKKEIRRSEEVEHTEIFADFYHFALHQSQYDKLRKKCPELKEIDALTPMDLQVYQKGVASRKESNNLSDISSEYSLFNAMPASDDDEKSSCIII